MNTNPKKACCLGKNSNCLINSPPLDSLKFKYCLLYPLPTFSKTLSDLQRLCLRTSEKVPAYYTWMFPMSH